jgi:uncharacterized DUF497 family protein
LTTSRPAPEFEFDGRKSRINKLKHGIDFVESQALWFDGSLLTGRAQESDERRLLLIGMIGDKHWAAVVTPRRGRVRIISVRRARKKEIAQYESQ